MPPLNALADALAATARDINTRQDLPKVLQSLVETTQRSLTGVDHVGISVRHSDGRIETLAASSEFVRQLDELQYKLMEGPSVEAILQDGQFVVNRADLEDRWPRYMSKAVPLGLRSQMGLSLYTDGATVGGLNLYSTHMDEFDPDVLYIAELFAQHAALAMGKDRLTQHMGAGMRSRQRVGQAVGILMERYELDEDRAFAYLSRVSQSKNVKLRKVAETIVSTVNQKNALPEDRPMVDGLGAPEGAPV